MDFPIYIPTTNVFVQTFFCGRSIAGEYPTYLQFGHMSENGKFFQALLVGGGGTALRRNYPASCIMHNVSKTILTSPPHL